MEKKSLELEYKQKENRSKKMLLWFGLVSWLMNKTGSLWDCVVAHAVTNLLLGIYVLIFAQWHLW